MLYLHLIAEIVVVRKITKYLFVIPRMSSNNITLVFKPRIEKVKNLFKTWIVEFFRKMFYITGLDDVLFKIEVVKYDRI